VQINTTITRRNRADFDAMARLLGTLDIALWSVFFLIPTGRGQLADLISGEECEEVFAKLFDLALRVSFDIKTTEAQHYRRYVLQQRASERRTNRSLGAFNPFYCHPGRAGESSNESTGSGEHRSGSIQRAPRGLNDAKGFVFISHVGEVFPSGFLPISGGNIRQKPLAQIYQHSPLFKSLRDTGQLKGKCGVCEFRHVCGGSRARAFALTGDPLAEEPCCLYVPKVTAMPQRATEVFDGSSLPRRADRQQYSRGMQSG
jgi:AdoMet-dependent heme synthase